MHYNTLVVAALLGLGTAHAVPISSLARSPEAVPVSASMLQHYLVSRAA